MAVNMEQPEPVLLYMRPRVQVRSRTRLWMESLLPVVEPETCENMNTVQMSSLKVLSRFSDSVLIVVVSTRDAHDSMERTLVSRADHRAQSRSSSRRAMN